MDIKKTLVVVAQAFHEKMSALSALRQESIGEKIPLVTAKILGQCALLLNDEAREKLSPVGTQDIDIQFEGGIERDILKADFIKAGLLVDHDSQYIWIVPGATFDTIFETEFVKVEVVHPLFNLTSKAIKAPEKNRELIRKALIEYGIELLSLIKQHGGDVKKFK